MLAPEKSAVEGVAKAAQVDAPRRAGIRGTHQSSGRKGRQHCEATRQSDRQIIGRNPTGFEVVPPCSEVDDGRRRRKRSFTVRSALSWRSATDSTMIVNSAFKFPQARIPDAQ